MCACKVVQQPTHPKEKAKRLDFNSPTPLFVYDNLSIKKKFRLSVLIQGLRLNQWFDLPYFTNNSITVCVISFVTLTRLVHQTRKNHICEPKSSVLIAVGMVPIVILSTTSNRSNRWIFPDCRGSVEASVQTSFCRCESPMIDILNKGQHFHTSAI